MVGSLAGCSRVLPVLVEDSVKQFPMLSFCESRVGAPGCYIPRSPASGRAVGLSVSGSHRAALVVYPGGWEIRWLERQGQTGLPQWW